MIRKKKLKVLIVESSRVITERLITLVEDLEEVKDTLYASGFCNVPNLLISEKVDVVIWGISFTDEIINTLADVRKTLRPFLFIVLSDYGGQEYKKRFTNMSADHFLNKTRDFERIPELIISKQTSRAIM